MKSTSKHAYVISVSLGTGCYRHIRISGAAKLSDLHGAILAAFGFEDDHAHAFFMDNRVWSKQDCYFTDLLKDQYGDEERYTGQFTLGDMELTVGRQFKYVFDFGDEWVFQCKVLKVLDEPCEKPVVVRSVGDAREQYPDLDEYDDDDDDDDEEYDEDEPDVTFPEVYSKAKLNALYGKLRLPGDIVALLHSYFDACAALYGVIPLWKVLQIYNLQNPKLSEEDFIALSEIVRHEEQFYCILGPDDLFGETQPCKPLDRELIHESLIAIDQYDYLTMKNHHRDKPYYIPEKADLLRYAEDGYFEETPQSRAMLAYLRSTHKLSAKRAADILHDLQLAADTADLDINFILAEMERMKVRFRNIEATNQFLQLFMDMRNHMRLMVNRGNTPEELVAKTSPEDRMPHAMRIGPNMAASLKSGALDINDMRREIMSMEMPNEDLRISMLSELNRIQNEASRAKVGRNDPCPCGSGKKYKHCCGK